MADTLRKSTANLKKLTGCQINRQLLSRSKRQVRNAAPGGIKR
jgi:hypothetical protein